VKKQIFKIVLITGIAISILSIELKLNKLKTKSNKLEKDLNELRHIIYRIEARTAIIG